VELENRLRLRRAMVRRGFAPYDAEWWHFTFSSDPGVALDIVIE
jgi:D-alanyl-D-alanine dipeptidase